MAHDFSINNQIIYGSHARQNKALNYSGPGDENRIDPEKFFELNKLYKDVYSGKGKLKQINGSDTLADYVRNSIADEGARRMQAGEITQVSENNPELKKMIEKKASKEDIEKYSRNVCIAGVCDVYGSKGLKFKSKKEGEMVDNRFEYNPNFTENAEQSGFEKVDKSKPLKKGDVVQVVGQDDYGERRPVHAMIVSGFDDKGQPLFYDNYNARNYNMRTLRKTGWDIDKMRAGEEAGDNSENTLKVWRLSDKSAQGIATPEQRKEYLEKKALYDEANNDVSSKSEMLKAKFKELGIPEDQAPLYSKELEDWNKAGSPKKYLDLRAIANNDPAQDLKDLSMGREVRTKSGKTFRLSDLVPEQP